MPLSPSALKPLLQLALVPGIGPQRLAALVHYLGSAERVLAAESAEISRLPGMGPALARRVREARTPEAEERGRKAMATLQRARGVALTPDDLAYPDAFRALPEPPYLVFVAGNLELLGRRGVAVVGTRTPTEYGARTAAALSGELARAGFVIVSGMAKGIDAAAHAAALDAGGATIGVLGNGIDRVYPYENRRLFERVREEGLLLTEFMPGEQPRAGNFPRRNRLVTALSQGTLVVEMGVKSGAQHTVNYTLEQGKEVFAVPGPIGSTVSAGTNQLIKEGARVVTSVEDVLEELEGVGETSTRTAPEHRRVETPEPRPAPAQMALDLSPEETRVLSTLAAEPRHVDDLAAAVDLPPHALLPVLLALELGGQIEALPGKWFRRVS